MVKIEDVLKDAYDSEINVTLSSFWDAGWVADVGDKSNGFKGDPVESDDLDDVAAGLVSEICKLYPDSKFAKKYSVSSDSESG